MHWSPKKQSLLTCNSIVFLEKNQVKWNEIIQNILSYCVRPVMQERFITPKETLFAHFIAYYSENILDSVTLRPHIEMTSFYY